MIDLAELLWSFSLISLFLHFFHVIKKVMVVTLGSGTATSSSSSSSSSAAAASSSVFYFGSQSKLQGWSRYYRSLSQTNFLKRNPSADSSVSTFSGEVVEGEGHSCPTTRDYSAGDVKLVGKKDTADFSCLESNPEARSRLGVLDLVEEGVKFDSRQPSTPRQESGVMVAEGLSSYETARKEREVNKVCSRMRKRPALIIIPESSRGFEAGEAGNDSVERDFEVQGREFCLASRKGRKRIMEDGYGVITNISGDSKQAFFGVYDGHGGRAAVDHVVDNLGSNILRALQQPNGNKDQTKMAVREGYLTTDKEFLAQGLGSGACAATLLIKGGEVMVANAGDCRVVLSRKGVAYALTTDHRPDREDERIRIENSGGYVNSHNGVWRVHGSLAISRAIGDSHMKDWIISEPEISTIDLGSDCEFLILASDGLWDKVSNQEAVEVVLRHKYSVEACKKLIDMACSRGNKDDITVMVVDLQNFT
ncbi:probable protein phosphatase 2C 74 [Aristolochia californica]|uniref:probable protein phosphatase 2C 74 n=1 Tax=Aristolochia californica TaxID=171875 RepID=UPI0035E15A27